MRPVVPVTPSSAATTRVRPPWLNVDVKALPVNEPRLPLSSVNCARPVMSSTRPSSNRPVAVYAPVAATAPSITYT